MQFLVSKYSLKDKVFIVEGEEAHHISTVLRKKSGDVIRLFDAKGQVFLGEITQTSPGVVHGKILEDFSLSADPLGLPYEISLYQALPKGQKWDWVLEKGTELGISRFVPLITSRTIPKIAPKDLPKKMSRWRKVLEAAAKQCGVPKIPTIEEPKNLEKVFSSIIHLPSSIFLFCWESPLARPIWEVLRDIPDKPKKIFIFIGPEGGWAASEVKEAQAQGFLPVGLGPLLLRTETAPLVAVSMTIACLG